MFWSASTFLDTSYMIWDGRMILLQQIQQSSKILKRNWKNMGIQARSLLKWKMNATNRSQRLSRDQVLFTSTMTWDCCSNGSNKWLIEGHFAFGEEKQQNLLNWCVGHNISCKFLCVSWEGKLKNLSQQLPSYNHCRAELGFGLSQFSLFSGGGRDFSIK